MSILSICFRGEIRKIFIWIFLFSGAMRNALCAGRSKQTLLTYSQLMTSFSYSWLVILKFKGLSEVQDIGTSTYQICRTFKPPITIAAENNFYFLFHRIKS